MNCTPTESATAKCHNPLGGHQKFLLFLSLRLGGQAAIVKIQDTGADAANLPSVKASVGLEVKRAITSVHDVAADRCGWRRHFVTLLMGAVYYPPTKRAPPPRRR